MPHNTSIFMKKVTIKMNGIENKRCWTALFDTIIYQRQRDLFLLFPIKKFRQNS